MKLSRARAADVLVTTLAVLAAGCSDGVPRTKHLPDH